MIPEDIEKLIGGYATGTLTEDERRKLFEAALDDQDLFNALHDEHTLKQLLDDPVSREMVRRAAALSQDRTSWFLRRWVWAAAAGAVGAAVLVISFVEFRQPAKPLMEIAQVHREVRPTLAVPAAPLSTLVEHKLKANRIRNPQGDSVATPVNVPEAPSAPAPQTAPQVVNGQLAAPVAAGFRGQDQMQMSAVSQKAGEMQSKQSVLRNAVGALAAPAAPIFYTLSRKMPNGDYLDFAADAALEPGESIRVTVIPRIAGPLGVWEWDEAHPTPTRIFPIVDADTVQLRAMENYAVPLDIVVTPGEHLRLTVGSSSVEIALPPHSK